MFEPLKRSSLESCRITPKGGVKVWVENVVTLDLALAGACLSNLLVLAIASMCGEIWMH